MIAHKFQNGNGGSRCEVRYEGRKVVARCNQFAEDHEGYVAPYVDDMPQTREELEAFVKKIIRECVLIGALDERT
jgi:hypothetical protein